MTVRDSNSLFLEVLTASPVSGVGLQVDVFDAGSLTSQLCTLQNASEVSFQKQLNDVGSGSFAISRYDPKATGVNLAKGNLVKIAVAGIYRFAFFIETIDEVVASKDGAAKEMYKVGGRGALAYLERAVLYPTGWPTGRATDVQFNGLPWGKIMKDFIDEAHARVPSVVPNLTYDFTDTVDSISDPWTDVNTLTEHVGQDGLAFAKKGAALGIDVDMDVDLGFHMYSSLGVDRRDSTIFRLGRHFGEQDLTAKQVLASLRTRLLVEGSSGSLLEVFDPALEVDPAIGRREGYLSYPSSAVNQDLSNAGNSTLAALADESQPLQIGVLHGPAVDENGKPTGDFDPFVDYDVGDVIAIDAAPSYDFEAFRIVSLTLAQKEGVDFSITLDLNSVFLELLLRLKNQLNGGGAVTSGGTVTNLSPGGGGPGSGSDGRVAAVAGDARGYLFDKITVGANLAKTLAGPPGNETVELDVTGATTAGQFVASFDGNGGVISAGKEQDVVSSFNGVLTAWELLADVAGNVVVDVYKAPLSSYPPVASITGSATPALSGSDHVRSTVLTGWTTAIAVGDVLRFHIVSASTIGRLLVVLHFTKT